VRSLQEWPNENLPPYDDYRRHIQKCEWFRIYQIIEGLYALLREKEARSFNGYTSSFATTVNGKFVSENIGWQLDYNGNVVTRGNEAFERSIKTAVAVLEGDDKPTAAGHLRFAIDALSARPKANTSGAVAQATLAVECVLGAITGATTSLGDYLKKNPSLLHPALKKGLDEIYGYASEEGARHGREGTEPAIEDAEFAVATYAAVCTLLIRKSPK
jgi:hypothetical protein